MEQSGGKAAVALGLWHGTSVELRARQCFKGFSHFCRTDERNHLSLSFVINGGDRGNPQCFRHFFFYWSVNRWNNLQAGFRAKMTRRVMRWDLLLAEYLIAWTEIFCPNTTRDKTERFGSITYPDRSLGKWNCEEAGFAIRVKLDDLLPRFIFALLTPDP